MNELAAFIAGIEALRTLNEDVAKAAEAGVLKAAQATAARGESPSGEKWPELADGGKALAGAAKAIAASSGGTHVDLKIGPPFVYHQHGAGGHSESKAAAKERKRAAAKQAQSGKKSKFHAPRRQILPEAGDPIPTEMNAAIQEAAARIFQKAVG